MNLLFDRQFSNSSTTLQRYLDKAMRLSPNDKSILVNIVHKSLMTDDLRLLQERSTPTKEFEMLVEEDKHLAEAPKQTITKNNKKKNKKNGKQLKNH